MNDDDEFTDETMQSVSWRPAVYTRLVMTVMTIYHSNVLKMPKLMPKTV